MEQISRPSIAAEAKGGIDETAAAVSSELDMSGDIQACRFQLTKQSLGWTAIQEILRENVETKYNFSLEKDCFTAEEAVDFLVRLELATSRSDAVKLGRVLESEHGLKNVKDKFQFADSEKIYCQIASSRNEAWRDELANARDYFTSNVTIKDLRYHLKV